MRFGYLESWFVNSRMVSADINLSLHTDNSGSWTAIQITRRRVQKRHRSGPGGNGTLSMLWLNTSWLKAEWGLDDTAFTTLLAVW